MTQKRTAGTFRLRAAQASAGLSALQWLQKARRFLFKLVGTKCNREAVGARITVVSNSRSQIEEVKAGSSYLSTNDPRLHFGLAADSVMGKVEIRWPDGAVEVHSNVPADAIDTVVEGQGITATVKLPPRAPR